MSIWGKLLGASAGFALGGPLGALLGGIAGHGVDKVRKSESKFLNKENKLDINTKQTIFATGVIALFAKLAKADGKVTKDEIKKFKIIFEFPQEDEKNISVLFNEAKKSSKGYEQYALQLYDVFKTTPLMLNEVVSSLFAVALADGELHVLEEQMISNIATIFKMHQNVYDSIKASYVDVSQQKETKHNAKLNEAYQILGLSGNFDEKDIKNNYRKLIKDYHPDKLMSYGLPKDFIDLANARVSKINEAYNYIKKAKL